MSVLQIHVDSIGRICRECRLQIKNESVVLEMCLVHLEADTCTKYDSRDT